LLPKFSLRKRIAELDGTLGDALLAVHRSYLSSITRLTKRDLVKGMSHVTGGGIVGNTMRIIPKGLSLAIDWKAWERPAIFQFIQKAGNVPEADMRRAFNNGIGLIVVAAKTDADRVMRTLRAAKEHPLVMGEVV
jgi:phosphoribosylformylglycinamidine cyclo-ligase